MKTFSGQYFKSQEDYLIAEDEVLMELPDEPFDPDDVDLDS